ncbi:unnamed protein product, partial [Amoebophrya sp. A120]
PRPICRRGIDGGALLPPGPLAGRSRESAPGNEAKPPARRRRNENNPRQAARHHPEAPKTRGGRIDIGGHGVVGCAAFAAALSWLRRRRARPSSAARECARPGDHDGGSCPGGSGWGFLSFCRPPSSHAHGCVGAQVVCKAKASVPRLCSGQKPGPRARARVDCPEGGALECGGGARGDFDLSAARWASGWAAECRLRTQWRFFRERVLC